jgi:hypothetical protein
MKRFVRPAIVFLFPFLYYSRFILPNSSLLVIENDFGFLYYVYKAYLVDSIAHGHFPLWSPAEAGGYSFFGNPFTAPIYPLNLIPVVVRLVAGHYTYWFHQIFTVFGVSLFALRTYRWLYGVFRKPNCALFVSLTLATSWSIGGFMRFPNAIHAIAWVPWVLSALYEAHGDSRTRSLCLGVFAAFCQITAGYPYFVVYSFFLYGAYVLYLHWASEWGEWSERKKSGGRLARQAFVLGVPILLSAPYASSVSHVMALTTDRAGGDFAYASEFQFGPVDVVGSFVFPPVATVEGCFYLGTLSVFIMAIYFLRSADDREKIAVVVGVLGFLAMILGYRSYLFAPIWSVLPIVNQMRVFPRMTVVLLPILAVALHQGVALLSTEFERGVNPRTISPMIAWSVFSTIFAVQLALYFGRSSLDDEYTKYYLHALPPGSREVDFLMSTLVALVVVLIVLRTDWASFRHGPMVALTILFVVVTLDTGGQGRFLWASSLSAVVRENGLEPGSGRVLVTQAWELAKRKADFYHLVREYFMLDRLGGRLGLNEEKLSSVPTPNFDYDTYTRFFRENEGVREQRDRLMGREKLFFHAAIHESVPAFLEDVAEHKSGATRPSVEYFDGNELRLAVASFQPGYLSWIDNMDPGWSAEVDGKSVPIELSMGTFKAIRLDAAGTHRVQFRYFPVISPFAYVALVTGALTLVSFALWDRRRTRGAQPTPSAS